MAIEEVKAGRHMEEAGWTRAGRAAYPTKEGRRKRHEERKMLN